MGGLTVARALNLRLPKERLVYLGDTARVPYGTKSPETVVKYAHRNMQFMREHDVKAVVVACNTVSAQGIAAFTQSHDSPVFGVIEPGAQFACAITATKKVAVLATPGTVQSNAYPRAIAHCDAAVRVFQVACPLFVPLAEEGWTDHAATRLIAHTYLQTLENSDVDTLILGCTHYPLLENIITEVAQNILGAHTRVINSAHVVADTVARTLSEFNLLSSDSALDHAFFATDVSERSQVVASRFWHDGGDSLPIFQHVDLPN